jgi:membrane protease YdiL (CAAX protease family)
MSDLHNAIKILISLIIFLFAGNLIVLGYYHFSGNTDLSYTTYAYLDVIISLFTIICLIIIYHDILIKDFKELKKSKIFDVIQLIIGAVITLFLIKIFSSILESIICDIFNIGQAEVENQQSVEALLKSAPLIMGLSVCILAPFEEELLFRGGIKKAIKNKRVFMSVSGLIFGLMHVTDHYLLLIGILIVGLVIDFIYRLDITNSTKVSMSIASIALIFSIVGFILVLIYGYQGLISSFDANELIGGITYVIAGLYLAHLYYAYDNIYINMGVHAANNIISMLISL